MHVMIVFIPSFTLKSVWERRRAIADLGSLGRAVFLPVLNIAARFIGGMQPERDVDGERQCQSE